MGMFGVRACALVTVALAFSGLWYRVRATESAQKQVTAADCTFVPNPDEFLARETRLRRGIAERVFKLDRAFPRAAVATASRGAEKTLALPQRNFIDAEIFGKLARLNVQPARLSTDEEFFRRINLDLTGRIPSPDDITAFVADTSTNKRDTVIDRLLFTPDFEDKWNIWLGDLLQINATSTNINRTTAGRDAFGFWVGQSIFSQKSFKDLAYEIVIATGNTYNLNTGAANFMLNTSTPMGPIQDTYDTALAKTAATFLGLAYYDCLLCHNGRGHLDQISLWGSNVTRVEAEKMAAFFSRLRLNRCGTPQGAPPDPAKPACSYNSYDVMNAAAGGYDLTTTYGNRPNRVPIGTVRTLTPEYRETGATPAGEWRDSFADNMVRDPMFTRNIANRLWKALFNLGLVDPVDTMDPARLDPKNPPPAPWTLQATHPELLEKLAEEFARRNFSLREFIRLLVESSAYQLSSRYDNEWKVDYVPLFARHYPRRLEGEEVHDVIAKATGVMGSYLLQSGDRVYWAMQLPEPAEPRSDSTGLGAADFMNTFFRGNRDTQQRSQAGSIQQQLALMNSAFVTNRLKVASAPRLKEISAIPSNEELLDQIFLLFLSRQPTDYERSRGLAFLSKATTTAMRNAAIEDLAWVCVNKGDFLFSY